MSAEADGRVKADIWMPLYIADYLADTAYLTTEQSGAYLHLLMAYWRNGPPPDNDAILASITKLSPDAWSNARASLEHYFYVSEGRWRNKRADEEIDKAKGNRQKAHDKAAKAAAARWAKQEEMIGALPQAKPEQSLKVCPSPSPKKEPSLRSGSAAKRGTRLPADWTLPYDWSAEAQVIGIPNGAVPVEAAKFRDYWCAKSGKDATKVDWLATWRNWCRNAVERTYGRSPTKPQGPTRATPHTGLRTGDTSQPLRGHDGSDLLDEPEAGNDHGDA